MTTAPAAPLLPTPDPRDPEDRLARFFDAGSMELLASRDTSGVLAARGTREGQPGDRLLHRRHRHGRRHGGRRLPAHRRRDRHRAARAGAGRRHLALRRRPAGRGRHRPARRRRGVRGDGPGLRAHPADLGRARRRRRRRRLRSGADRHRDHGPGRAGVRHRAGRRPLGHRRERRPGDPRRPGHPRPALRRRARGHRLRAGGAGDRAAGRRPAGRPGHLHARPPTSPTSTSRPCCRSSRSAPTTSSR